jgi:alpha-tubulin suppressor-like RCC1 family protein
MRTHLRALASATSAALALALTVLAAPTATAAATTSVSAGLTHACAVTTSGGVRCWGDNAAGELGNATTTASLTPVDVVGLSERVIAVSAGAHTTCALTAAGGVLCWGDGGHTGDGTTIDRTTPVPAAGLGSGVTQITVGWAHACAALDDGTVRCWGANAQGSLGDGTTTASTVPVTVPGLTEVVGVTAGGLHTCALTSSGATTCWGYNAYGQVGNGSTSSPGASVLSPTDVVGLGSGVASIAAGGYHTCAILDDASTRCWGLNGSGQLGDGTTENRSEPTAVQAPTGSYASLAPGEYHTCAVTIAGASACWGANDTGALGTGDAADRSVPTPRVGAGSGTLALDGGRWTTCRVDTSGRTSCSGWNLFGQLGIGVTSVAVTTERPVAWFAPSFVVSCSGLQCRVTDASRDPDGEIATRAWTFGDGGSATGTVASRTYAAAGTYTVELTASDAFGASVRTSAQVTVAAWNLRASVAKVKNMTTVSLTWDRSATTAASVDVFRNGARVATTPNTGSFSQTLTKGTWSYVVCPTGDARCSNGVTVKA